jgi:hypothetical protein
MRAALTDWAGMHKEEEDLEEQEKEQEGNQGGGWQEEDWPEEWQEEDREPADLRAKFNLNAISFDNLPLKHTISIKVRGEGATDVLNTVGRLGGLDGLGGRVAICQKQSSSGAWVVVEGQLGGRGLASGRCKVKGRAI